MLVLNLRCAHAHPFEGWFASATDFDEQVERRSLSCPTCGNQAVERLPSAPRLNTKNAQAPAPEAPAADQSAPAPNKRAELGALITELRQRAAEAEDVGDRFAQEARAIHHGDAEARGIRGRASPDDARALLDEGIGILRLPPPAGSLH